MKDTGVCRQGLSQFDDCPVIAFYSLIPKPLCSVALDPSLATGPKGARSRVFPMRKIYKLCMHKIADLNRLGKNQAGGAICSDRGTRRLVEAGVEYPCCAIATGRAVKCRFFLISLRRLIHVPIEGNVNIKKRTKRRGKFVSLACETGNPQTPKKGSIEHHSPLSTIID